MPFKNLLFSFKICSSKLFGGDVCFFKPSSFGILLQGFTLNPCHDNGKPLPPSSVFSFFKTPHDLAGLYLCSITPGQQFLPREGELKIRHVTGTVKISGFHGLRQLSWVQETWGAKELTNTAAADGLVWGVPVATLLQLEPPLSPQ